MQRECILIFGQTGCGKTTLAGKILKDYPRVLVADAGFQDYHGIKYTHTYPELVEALDREQAFGSRRPIRIAYGFKPSEYPMIFRTSLEMRHLLLVLEEGDRFDLNDDGYVDCLFRGRHYGVSILYISLHPRACPTEVRRQATRIISFKQIFPDDIDWLAEVVGEAAFKLPQLGGPPETPPHPYLEWTTLTGAVIKGECTGIDPRVIRG